MRLLLAFLTLVVLWPAQGQELRATAGPLRMKDIPVLGAEVCSAPSRVTQPTLRLVALLPDHPLVQAARPHFSCRLQTPLDAPQRYQAAADPTTPRAPPR
jgi:hypothetical protein